ncbi:hypothetical protein B5C34_01565 [Pacificimonas flava]|uniref:O-antigen ligase-related domain-containing protein n=2 Tax=Pacificimonas TaxID=1960290 RepID=A0A219B1R2_9SPHN|nr:MULTISPECIES: O-antigen ligase family protein [Pacificimonas]MBZ6378095.1 O-antigen ligase family protein [Pacificimonas aurantium]OWV32265.1 hypothetical protein B5C34_01565 [Pacificimonas flava]
MTSSSRPAFSAAPVRSGARLHAPSPLALLLVLLAALPALAALMFPVPWNQMGGGLATFAYINDFLFAAAEVAFIVYMRRRGRSVLRPLWDLGRADGIALGVFLALFWVSSVFVSQQPAFSLVRVLLWVVHGLFGLAVFEAAKAMTRHSMSRAAAGVACGVLLLAALTAVHIAALPASVLRGSDLPWDTMLPGFMSARQLGFTAAAAMGLLAGYLSLGAERRPEAAIAFAGLLVASALLCFSGTRSGVLAFVAGAVPTVFLCRTNLKARGVLAACGAILLGALASTLWVPEHPAFGIERILGIAAASPEGEISAGRTQLWMLTAGLIGDAPLLGHGENAALWLLKPFGYHHFQPHNIVLQAALSWGLPAALAAGYLAVRMWSGAAMAVRRDNWAMPLFLALNTLLIMAMLDGVLHAGRTVQLAAALAAMLLAIGRRHTDAE